LLVEDDREHRADDVIEAALRRELDQREAARFGGGHHRRRDLLEVAIRLDRDPGQSLGRELGDQRAEGGSVVPQRIGRGQEQLVRLHPGEDVRHLHDIDVPDTMSQAGTSREHPRIAQGRQIEGSGDGD
jgi:hypothetical protein